MFTLIQAAGWPIWPLIICSIVALALVIERSINLQSTKIAPSQLLEEALSAARHGVPSSETVLQLEKNSVLGEVLASGLHTLQTHPHSTHEDILSGMESAGRIAAHRLEKHLAALATIASAAPLLGLFGTVIGMIDIFGAQPAGISTGSNAPAIPRNWRTAFRWRFTTRPLVY